MIGNAKAELFPDYTDILRCILENLHMCEGQGYLFTALKYKHKYYLLTIVKSRQVLNVDLQGKVINVVYLSMLEYQHIFHRVISNFEYRMHVVHELACCNTVCTIFTVGRINI